MKNDCRQIAISMPVHHPDRPRILACANSANYEKCVKCKPNGRRFEVGRKEQTEEKKRQKKRNLKTGGRNADHQQTQLTVSGL